MHQLRRDFGLLVDRARTWHIEFTVVALVLAIVNIVAGASALEWIGAGAVLFSFGHANIADRMAERQASMPSPSVPCFRWSVRYFVAKEALWVVYFIVHHSYAALVGCIVFIIHPIWRRWYRRRWPLVRAVSTA